MGAFEEIGKSVLQSVINGAERRRREQTEQERQVAMREFAAHEHEIQNAAENGDMQSIRILASVYYNQGDYEKSVDWALKGADDDDELCLHILGEIYVAEKEYGTAEKFFLLNMKINSSTISAISLGNLYIANKNFSDAEQCFGAVFQDDNTNPEAAFGLAICKMEDPNTYLEDVEELLQTAVRSQVYSTRDAAQQMLQQIQQEKTRRAQQQNNGCFITTAVCDSFGKADDCFELTTFRKFRDGWLTAQSDGKSLIAEYYSIAPKIVDKINALTNAAQIYENIWREYLEPCLNFIRDGNNSACKNKYVDMVNSLKAKYL